tara:strand:+ start:88 stop:738 length:651 start_codon:yes stop_codon:yes gene_type:complete
MELNDIVQGSSEWHELRLGKITASNLANVLAVGRSGGESLTRIKYKNDLVRERLTHKYVEGYINAAMERGTALEPLARASYEVKYNVLVDQIAFIDHPYISNSGCSPDGLVGDDGLIEIKVRNPSNHLASFLDDGKELRQKYYTQTQWQMACMPERKWVDLVSFDPDMDMDLQLFVIRIPRDEEFIKMAEEAAMAFNDEITTTILKLKEIKNGNNT